ncbi:hypothetical protein KKP62_06855 [Rhodococcus sp. GOMB7]|uniref:acyl-[acyl-carrier-protein] thioesterase n=1 Tax=Rhodococcus sp. GOMB7 TaxID=2839033 RepID=UPI001C00394E|nr:acyl-ACP thioesterase domain-containing protein [Rhodococcus sp. GOMB7]MBT9294683.1 hypothetical protein [Rhodococcus sp. GOMB7]
MEADAMRNHRLVDLPTKGAVFETSRPVRTGDIDVSGTLRLDGVARYLQDIGFDDLDASGAAAAHPVWVVRRTVIDVIRPVSWPARVRMRRWCSGLSSRWCTMRVRIESDGGGLIETEGFWINLNPVNGMPSRIEESFMAGLGSTANDHRLKWKPWHTAHPGDGEETTFVLRSSDIDPFNHVNNATYWQPVEDLIRDWAGPRNPLPYRAILEYRSPITAGNDVTVRYHSSGESLSSWFLVSGSVCASAYVTAIEV